MTNTKAERFEVEIHTEISNLETEWRALETSGWCTAFQRYDFVAPLYSAFRDNARAEPLIVLVRDAASRQLLLVLPLCIAREDGIDTVGFADLRVADYCAPIMARSFASSPEEFRRLWHRIEGALPRGDLVRLRKMPDCVGEQSNPLLWLSPCAPYHVKAHGVPLANPWDEHSKTIIKKKKLQDLRRNEHNLARIGDLTFEIVDAGQAAQPIFAVLDSMRRKRFSTLGREDVMADPMWSSFYRDLASRVTANPLVKLITLKAGDATVACGLGLGHNGSFMLLIPSFDMEKFGRHSPGRLLIFQAMKSLTDAGLTYFDLTIGDEPYKETFGVDDRMLFEVVRPLNVRGYRAAAVWRLKVGLRRYPKLHARMKQWLGRK